MRKNLHKRSDGQNNQLRSYTTIVRKEESHLRIGVKVISQTKRQSRKGKGELVLIYR